MCHSNESFIKYNFIKIIMSTPTDSKFYIEGAKKMVAEGIEAVSKIMAFMKENESALTNKNENDRKKAILEFEPSKLFNQIHPIVFHYLTVEGVFNSNAFRRYVISVFGKPRSKEDEEYMRKDRKNLYRFKNAQQALYYKYLLFETNPNVNKNTLHAMYDEVVQELNADSDKMLMAYEKAEKDSKKVEESLTEQKRKDLVQLFKKRMSENN